MHLTVAERDGIKNVAIVSVIPEKVNIVKPRLLGYASETEVLDLGGRLSATVESVATARISSARPKWVIKEVEYDRNVLYTKLRSNGLVWADGVERLQGDLTELMKRHNLDVVFVIDPQRLDHFGPIFYDEVGVIVSSTFGTQVSVFSNIGVKVILPGGAIRIRVTGQGETPDVFDPQELGLGDRWDGTITRDALDRIAVKLLAHVTQRLNERFDELAL
jgi:hypothetical protein